jgi:hypothetical protein
MDFDIYKLDNVDPESEEANKLAEEYQNALVEKFAKSPEGESRLRVDPQMGFWTAQLIYLGYSYNGVTVPAMTVGDVEEIVTELFPRKVSMSSPDDADTILPELVVFWEYLEREYKLPNAKLVLRFLHEIEPEFKETMNDPSKFGMAKSLFMMGQSAGFDMTKKEDSDAFITMYNANLMAEREGQQNPSQGYPDSFTPKKTKLQSKKAKKKKRRIANASRKKTRKKRK